MLTRMPSHVALARRCFWRRRTSMNMWTSREKISSACAEFDSYIIKLFFKVITTGNCTKYPLRKRLRIRSVISVNYHYITVLCPFNLLFRFRCYKTCRKTNEHKENYYVMELEKQFRSCERQTFRETHRTLLEVCEPSPWRCTLPIISDKAAKYLIFSLITKLNHLKIHLCIAVAKQFILGQKVAMYPVERVTLSCHSKCLIVTSVYK